MPRRLLSYYSLLPVSGKICRWERTSFWRDFYADKYQQSEIRRFSWMKARAKPSHPNPLCSPVMSRGSSNLSTVLCKFQKASLSCHHCSLTSILEGAESTPWNPSSNWKCALLAYLFNPSDIRWKYGLCDAAGGLRQPGTAPGPPHSSSRLAVSRALLKKAGSSLHCLAFYLGNSKQQTVGTVSLDLLALLPHCSARCCLRHTDP